MRRATTAPHSSGRAKELLTDLGRAIAEAAPAARGRLELRRAHLLLCANENADAKSVLKSALDHGGEGLTNVVMLLAGEYLRAGDLSALVQLYTHSGMLAESPAVRAELIGRALELLPQACAQDPELASWLDEQQRRVPLFGELVQYQPKRARRLAATIEAAGLKQTALSLREMLLHERHDPSSFEDAMALASLANQLGQSDRAYEAYRSALSLRPAERHALAAAREHLRAREAFESLAELLAVSAPAAETPTEEAMLWRELALLAEDELSDTTRAIQAWWRAWELSNYGDEAQQLKRLYVVDERWDRYFDVLRHEVLRTTNLVTRAEVLRELAEFQLEALGDELGAAITYGHLLQTAPDDQDALERSVDLMIRTDPDGVEITAVRRMVERLARTGCSVEQRDAGVWRLLDLQLARGETQQVPADLRMLDLRRSDSLQRAEALWKQSLESKDGSECSRELGLALIDAELRGRPLDWAIRHGITMAEHSAQIGRKDVAIACFRRLSAAAPNHEELAQKLQQLEETPPPPNRGHSLPRELAERAKVASTHDGRQAARLYLRAAQSIGNHPRLRVQVAQMLVLAHESCPSGAHIELQLIERALRDGHFDAELIRFYQRELDNEPGERRQSALLAALAEQHQRSGLLAEAVGELERLHLLRPDDNTLVAEIVKIHRKLGNHLELATWLQIMLEDGTCDRAPLLEELGALHSEELSDEALATRYFIELLALKPNHEGALAFVRGHAQDADARQVAILLARAAEANDTPAARYELFEEVARLAEDRLGDIELAISQWRQLQTIAPTALKPRRELKRLLASSERYSDLESLLVAEVSRTADAVAKVDLYLELATLARSKLGAQKLAVRHLRAATQIAPERVDVLESLAELYEELEQWRELATVLERCAEHEPDTERRVLLLHRAARVLIQRLQRDEEALAVCRRIRELSPADAQSAELMAGIYRGRGAWKSVATVLQEQCAAETQPQRGARLHVEIGQVLLEQLGAPEQAAQHFEQALELDAERGEVLPVLRELYTSLERWNLLTELIRRQALQEGTDEDTRARALQEVGEIELHHTRDLAKAREAFEQALRILPGHLPSLRALRELAEAQQDWRETVSLARRELEVLEHAPDRARLRVLIADLLRRQLDRPSAAKEALEQALEDDPSNPEALRELATDHFMMERFAEAATLLERLIDHGSELADLHVQLFRLGYALEHAGKRAEAFANYVKSFSREPLYLPTLERLVDLCYERNQWENTQRIAEAIIATFARQKSPTELADLFVRLGLCELHIAQVGVALKRLRKVALKRGQHEIAPPEAWEDVARAWAASPAEPQLLKEVDFKVVTRVIKAMEQALQRVSDHPGALQVLAALTMSHGDWDRSLRYLDRAAEAEELAAQQRARLLVAAGDVAVHRLLSRRRGEEYYLRATTLNPESLIARKRLEDTLERGGRLRASGVRTEGMPPAPPSKQDTQVGPIVRDGEAAPRPQGALAPLRRPGGDAVAGPGASSRPTALGGRRSETQPRGRVVTPRPGGIRIAGLPRRGSDVAILTQRANAPLSPVPDQLPTPLPQAAIVAPLLPRERPKAPALAPEVMEEHRGADDVGPDDDE